MQVDTNPQWVYDGNKNAHLRPRQRFRADLEDLEALCVANYEVHELRLKSIVPGEDDGSFVVAIENKESKPVVEANFLISDTSDYPKSHSLFCHSVDPDISPWLEAVLESVVDQPAQPLKDAIDSFLRSVADAVASRTHVVMKADRQVMANVSDTDDDWEGFDSESTEEEEGEEEEEEEEEVNVSKYIIPLLQREFIDTVGSSYTPGIIRIGDGNDFVLSVSVPVMSLAEWIPQRALMAWDLRESDHLVLLISGFGGIYPVLQSDGTYTPAAQNASAKLSFRVGLSSRYKPGKAQTRDAVNKDGLVIADRLDQLQIMALEKKNENYDDDDNVEGRKSEQDDFRAFILSSPLESLLDQAFLRVLQYRRRFGLGWAGADTLYRELEDHQQTPEEALTASFEIVTATEEAEVELLNTLVLPHDPLVVLPSSEPINLPLVAFSYLIRHLTLCTKYCISCRSELNTDENAPTPYVCNVKLCPQYKTGSLTTGTQIPSLPHQKRPIADQWQTEAPQHGFDDEDMTIFNFYPNASSQSQSKGKGKGTATMYRGGESDDEDYRLPPKPAVSPEPTEDFVEKPPDDWKHDPSYVQQALDTFTLPPIESSGSATIALQKELMLTLKEQRNAKSLKELGWYVPTELLGDNLYQWIVEMHSFDANLPIAKDMAKNNINSIVFEIRFLPTFPMSPPFFRIITPRLLGFFRGGGGNVTIGWVPSYTIPAVLVQIRLAITNTEPRPAKLAPNWQEPYSVSESLEGFKRTAGNHGWKVPDGLDELVA